MGGQIDFERALNPAQRAAVMAAAGPHLVIAGAGSGKTRTLIYRVAYLVEEGVPPESVLLLTFTRRAAQQMLRRAVALLDERCHRVAGGTFHSFASLVLRRYAKELGYESNFTILDRSDSADLLGVLRTELGLDRSGRRFPRKETLIDLFSRAVNTSRPLEQVLAEEYRHFEPELPALNDLRRRFEERKKEQNVMDYDDLLTNLRSLLRDHEELRRRLASRYRYLLVDEYQDTNRLQAHISALLASPHGNLMVVGDDAQSIYSFRGADFRNIMDFPKIFPGCTTTFLEQNYRSSQPILDLSNAILASARERFPKRLFTTEPGEAKPVFVRTTDEHAQARFVADSLLGLREEGVALQDIAVLARAAWHTNTLEIELQRRNVPFRKFGGIKLVEAAHIKDVVSLLKMSANPRDVAAWFRFLQLLPGIGAKTAQRLAQAASRAAGETFAVLRSGAGSLRARRAQEKLADVLAELAPLHSDIGRCLEVATAYYAKLAAARYDDLERRLADLDSLLVVAERYSDLRSFLADLAIDPPEVERPGESPENEDEWVTLSTVHSAKGLEWHTVFVLNLTAGCFPSWASRDAESIEEERRLLYVAVTRAKRRLFLLKPEIVSRRGAGTDLAQTSPLLTEIGDFRQLVEERLYVEAPADPDAAETAEAAPGESYFDSVQGYFEGETSPGSRDAR
jgi:DNA helicase-2/ATP-dependent DNA helicase PcrA